MITKEKIVKCAEAIVYGMNLKEGEAVLIRGGTHLEELLEEIGISCYRKGAHPLIMATSDNYAARIYGEIPKETLETTPKHLLGAIKDADAYITVEPLKDPQVQTKFPREKIAAKTKANIPLRKILYGEETGRGKKWTYAGWPTPEAAKFYKVEYEDLEHMIIEGIMISASTLKGNTSQVAQCLRGKNLLRITDQKGTNFTCKIGGRRINEDDGLVDDHDIEINDLGNNLPAGEVFIAPHETFGEGTLFCPITIDNFTNKIVKNITLNFKDGKLLLDKCTAEVNGDQMINSFKQCVEIDQKEGEKRTTHIAELGIGCNPAINKAIGYILTDEKLSGSIHVAFGSNQGYGGTSKSCIHWDFVTDPTATIEVIDTKEKIMEDGKIL